MAFFCAGGSSAGNAKKSKGSRPHSKNTAITSNGQRISAESASQAPLPTIPHSNSIDLPHMRRMIVVQEYKPQDNRGLAVQRGESVQVINQDGEWMYVRSERKKEGFVPAPYLVAPYTSTRSRTSSRSNGTTSIRAVSSGSSVESSPKLGVPMIHSQSAGRPRMHSADRDQELRESRLVAVRRVASPPGPTMTSVAMNHDLHSTSTMSHTTSYEQKCSPSSSSGVASLNGPSSPSFTSLHQSTSQENFNNSSESSLNRSPDGRSAKSSLSSIEVAHDGAERPIFPSAVSPVFNHHNHLDGARSGGPSGEETVSHGKATSESNLTSLKVPRNPTPPRSEPPPSRPPVRPRHVYTELRGESPPPPVPPRNIPGGHLSATQGDTPMDTYSQPVDAINGYKEHIPGLDYPRVRTCSLTDVRPRDTPIVNNTQYSAVYNGKQKPPSKLLIPSHRHYNGSSASSETESPQTSRRSSTSKKTCSLTRNRRLDDGMHYMPREKMPRVPGASAEDRGDKSSQTRICKFRRCLWGLFIVMEDFEALDENEVSVKKGEHVSVWNQDDREWYWVVKHTRNYSEEGLVPSCLLCEASNESKSATSLETLSQRNPPTLTTGITSSPKQPRTPSQLHHPDRTPPLRTRPRLSSTGHDSRPLTSVPQSSVHRSASGSASHRQRLGSDSSSHSASVKVPRTPSTVSIEKEDIPESPPSSPPPPYSEVDSNPRHASFSLSQQPNGSAGGNYAVPMHRTRSHGQVSSPAYLVRARATVQQLPSPMADPSRAPRGSSSGSRDAHTPLSQGMESLTQSGTLV